MIGLLLIISLLTKQKQPTRPLYPGRMVCVQRLYIHQYADHADTTGFIWCHSVRDDLRKA